MDGSPLWRTRKASPRRTATLSRSAPPGGPLVPAASGAMVGRQASPPKRSRTLRRKTRLGPEGPGRKQPGAFAETRRFPRYPQVLRAVPKDLASIPRFPRSRKSTARIPKDPVEPRRLPKRPVSRGSRRDPPLSTGPRLPRRGEGGLRWKAKGTGARQSPSGSTVEQFPKANLWIRLAPAEADPVDLAEPRRSRRSSLAPGAALAQTASLGPESVRGQSPSRHSHLCGRFTLRQHPGALACKPRVAEPRICGKRKNNKTINFLCITSALFHKLQRILPQDYPQVLSRTLKRVG